MVVLKFFSGTDGDSVASFGLFHILVISHSFHIPLEGESSKKKDTNPMTAEYIRMLQYVSNRAAGNRITFELLSGCRIVLVMGNWAGKDTFLTKVFNFEGVLGSPY